jgi:hypothetical protein
LPSCDHFGFRPGPTLPQAGRRRDSDGHQCRPPVSERNQLRGLLDDELLPRKEFYALFNVGRTIVKMLGEHIGD